MHKKAAIQPPARFGLMLHEAQLAQVRALLADRRRRLEALDTRADADAYVRAVRRCVRSSFGKMPPRTPLNTRIAGRVKGPGYAIERLVYESRPGFQVTANLYVPAAAGRHPAVLMLCGHSGTGKQFELYQTACHALAVKGFLVLTIDPVEQGERHQFEHVPEKKRPGLCAAHCLMGNQQVLVGDFFGSWRAWDAIRGLDLLLARPEADPARVGVTGNSGGGTLTAYVAALDPRPTMVAPSCYICSHEANLQNELPSDAEQNPPGILKRGLDQADLLVTYAPRPTLILGQQDDMFDARYTRQAGKEVDRLHRLLGSRGTAEVFIGPRGHGFSIENREAMVAFFMKHTGLKGESREAPFKPRPEAVLNATPEGSVVKAGSRRVQDFTRDDAAFWRRARGNPSLQTLRRDAMRLLGVTKPARPPHYRLLRGGYEAPGPFRVVSQFGLETEPGIMAIVSCLSEGGGVMHPAPGRALLYVGHEAGLRDVREISAVQRLAKGEKAFFVVDPRGIGESMASTCGVAPFLSPYGSDYLYAATGEMLGESLLGRRVFDVLGAIDFLLENGAEEVRLAGRGLGSITAAFAALLHPDNPHVRLLDYLPSYEALVKHDLARWPLSSMLRGVLRHFDLPDVYAALGNRLTRSTPWDAVLSERTK